VAYKTALASQAGKITCPRSGNNNPCRLDPAVFDGFSTLKHEGAFAFGQFSAESLHADQAGGSIGAEIKVSMRPSFPP
jgi:hypothetical protein